MRNLTLVFTKMLRSKTLIVNTATLIAATLTLWVGSDVIALYPEAGAILVSALAGVNILLRTVTTLGLDEK